MVVITVMVSFDIQVSLCYGQGTGGSLKSASQGVKDFRHKNCDDKPNLKACISCNFSSR